LVESRRFGGREILRLALLAPRMGRGRQDEHPLSDAQFQIGKERGGERGRMGMGEGGGDRLVSRQTWSHYRSVYTTVSIHLCVPVRRFWRGVSNGCGKRGNKRADPSFLNSKGPPKFAFGS